MELTEYEKQVLINQSTIMGALSAIINKLEPPYQGVTLQCIQIALNKNNELLGVDNLGNHFGL